MILNNNWVDTDGQTHFSGERVTVIPIDWRKQVPVGWLSEHQIQLRIDSEAIPIAPEVNPSNNGDNNTINTLN
jgi:hypothetical protein